MHLNFHSYFYISFIYLQLRQWLSSQMALRIQQSRASQQKKTEQTFQTSGQNSACLDNVTIMIKLTIYFIFFFLKHSLFNLNYNKLCYFSSKNNGNTHRHTFKNNSRRRLRQKKNIVYYIHRIIINKCSRIKKHNI